MTPLAKLVAAEIEAAGPMPLSRYMDLCLLHPRHGYYATRDPFGQQGDFTTAPEISQMFGELVGLFVGQCWLDQGRPRGVLAELGPGRGTLMADARRALRVVPGSLEALGLHLVEASPHLRGVQRRNLGAVIHHDTAADLPDAPLFLIANEFFDALPIRQHQRVQGGWAERLVGMRGGGLALGLGPVVPGGPEAPEGTVRERCEAAVPIMAAIAARIRRHGGVALILDYGGWDGTGDTFQALRDHRPVDPFETPGEADLTAHVDFAALAATATQAGLSVGYTTQGALLEALGIGARTAALAAAGDAAAPIARRRLTDAAEMGQLFKALAVWPSNRSAPAGFTSDAVS